MSFLVLPSLGDDALGVEAGHQTFVAVVGCKIEHVPEVDQARKGRAVIICQCCSW